MLKSRNLPKNNIIRRFSFLILNTRIVFNYLQLAFIKTLILRYFDLKNHIWIKTNISSYIINNILNQPTFKISWNKKVMKTNLSQWYQIVFFLRKIILVKT